MMKLAKQIAEEHYRGARAIHDLNHPMARGMLENIVAAKLEPVREALSAIAGPCSTLTSHRCIDEPERYTVGAYFGDDRVCDACVADRALALFGEGS